MTCLRMIMDLYGEDSGKLKLLFKINGSEGILLKFFGFQHRRYSLLLGY